MLFGAMDLRVHIQAFQCLRISAHTMMRPQALVFRPVSAIQGRLLVDYARKRNKRRDKKISGKTIAPFDRRCRQPD